MWQLGVLLLAMWHAVTNDWLIESFKEISEKVDVACPRYMSVFSMEFGTGVAVFSSNIRVHGRLFGLSLCGGHVWKDICERPWLKCNKFNMAAVFQHCKWNLSNKLIVLSFCGQTTRQRFPQKLKKSTLQKQSCTQSFSPKVVVLFAFDRCIDLLIGRLLLVTPMTGVTGYGFSLEHRT